MLSLKALREKNGKKTKLAQRIRKFTKIVIYNLEHFTLQRTDWTKF
jgi:hypothetical protein